MPTPAQVSWQAWAAVALGAKGLVFYLYGFPTEPHPDAPAVRASWITGRALRTKAPRSLVVWPSFRTTPQSEALVRCYRDISRIGPSSLDSDWRLRTGRQCVCSGRSPATCSPYWSGLVRAVSSTLAVVRRPEGRGPLLWL